MSMNIIGAGMAGLLAGQMLKRHSPVILQAQPALPNNHSAVLRFGSSTIGDLLGIPFRPVKMIKAHLPWQNKVADVLSYSIKCSGVARSDRSIIRESQGETRWIAPDNLISRMAEGLDIEFNNKVVSLISRMPTSVSPIISTIPMPFLMQALNFDTTGVKFEYVSGANLRMKIPNCDAYVSLYVPDPKLKFNRISITGNELIAEYAFPGLEPSFLQSSIDRLNPFNEADAALDLLGFPHWSSEVMGLNPTLTPQKYSKILPIDDGLRRRFLGFATDKFNIFSLGRFATWKPGLLLDDLVQDIRQIEKWSSSDRYSMRFKR